MVGVKMTRSFRAGTGLGRMCGQTHRKAGFLRIRRMARTKGGWEGVKWHETGVFHTELTQCIDGK